MAAILRRPYESHEPAEKYYYSWIRRLAIAFQRDQNWKYFLNYERLFHFKKEKYLVAPNKLWYLQWTTWLHQDAGWPLLSKEIRTGNTSWTMKDFFILRKKNTLLLPINFDIIQIVLFCFFSLKLLMRFRFSMYYENFSRKSNVHKPWSSKTQAYVRVYSTSIKYYGAKSDQQKDRQRDW